MPVELKSHKVNGLNDSLRVTALDGPGPGGAHHHYDIVGVYGGRAFQFCEMKFQDGPLKEVGVNGISNEALLAIVEHRLTCFQNGPYTCRENALALTKVQEAIHWLKHRTEERIKRGIEGTSVK